MRPPADLWTSPKYKSAIFLFKNGEVTICQDYNMEFVRFPVAEKFASHYWHDENDLPDDVSVEIEYNVFRRQLVGFPDGTELIVYKEQ